MLHHVAVSRASVPLSALSPLQKAQRPVLAVLPVLEPADVPFARLAASQFFSQTYEYKSLAIVGPSGLGVLTDPVVGVAVTVIETEDAIDIESAIRAAAPEIDGKRVAWTVWSPYSFHHEAFLQTLMSRLDDFPLGFTDQLVWDLDTTAAGYVRFPMGYKPTMIHPPTDDAVRDYADESRRGVLSSPSFPYLFMVATIRTPRSHLPSFEIPLEAAPPDRSFRAAAYARYLLSLYGREAPPDD